MTSTLTVLFDADCGVCTSTARLLLRLDRRGLLRLVPLQTATVSGAPPRGELLDALHAVDAEGSWWVGADAVVEIAKRVTVLRPISAVARLPMARSLLDDGYRTVAHNRQRLSRALGLTACEVPLSAETGRQSR